MQRVTFLGVAKGRDFSRIPIEKWDPSNWTNRDDPFQNPGVDVLEFYAADKIDESWAGGKVLRAERSFAFDGA